MKKNIPPMIIAFLFVILFLYTGSIKLMDYSLFKEQIAASPVLRPISSWAAILLPLSEFAVVILLLVPRWRLKGLYAALGLMVLFTGYIGAILLLANHIPCSCGGVIEQLSWKGHLIFNGLWTGLALTGILLQWTARKSVQTNATLVFH
jgi:uncharacterized membrane protein YphA (DoxX/SURF4 family)